MKTRNDLLIVKEGLEVIQLTDEEKYGSSHVYMEAQIFFPDSKRFVLHRAATAHGVDRMDPEHRYLLCDIENGCSLEPLTQEIGVLGPAVSPDGRFFYYFNDETQVNGGRLALKRIDFGNNRKKETVTVIDAPLHETGTIPSRVYPLSTISSDGKKIAVSAFLGDGEREKAPWGLLVFDIEKEEVSVALQGYTFGNMHPQYCRSRELEFNRDIMIQENHGNVFDRYGVRKTLVSGKGADIHVIRDDGSNFRTMPWGRDGREFCTGHECWRGRSCWAIASVWYGDNKDVRLIESVPVKGKKHTGLKIEGGMRNDLSMNFDNPGFGHFATDMEGKLIVSDYFLKGIFLARLQEEGRMPAAGWMNIADSRSSGKKTGHIHPFLSPDGKKAFFNSDESGILQAYMITGLENLKI
ncbi:MAG TPA: hypothetical protein PKN36_07240 [bacterium]|nr:hypothetical protein [bacterium]